MKIAAFTYINFFDNEMKQKIVEVENDATWKDVLAKCFDILYPNGVDIDQQDQIHWLEDMSDDLGEAREEMVDGEMDIVVTFYEPKANFLEK